MRQLRQLIIGIILASCTSTAIAQRQPVFEHNCRNPLRSGSETIWLGSGRQPPINRAQCAAQCNGFARDGKRVICTFKPTVSRDRGVCIANSVSRPVVTYDGKYGEVYSPYHRKWLNKKDIEDWCLKGAKGVGQPGGPPSDLAARNRAALNQYGAVLPPRFPISRVVIEGYTREKFDSCHRAHNPRAVPKIYFNHRGNRSECATFRWMGTIEACTFCPRGYRPRSTGCCTPR